MCKICSCFQVIIYFSSARNDSHLERSLLIDSTKHQLHKFCCERNLDLELIDLNNLPSELKPVTTECDNWSLLTDDRHRSSDIRLKLIRKSFNESVGPCVFVRFLSSKVLVTLNLNKAYFDQI